MTLARKFKRAVFRACASSATTTWGAKAANVASTLDRAFRNDSDNSESNGERRLLQLLAPTEPRTVLDVGANSGDWTAQVLDVLPSAHVHAFEPVAEPHRQLLERFRGDSRVEAHLVALTSAGRPSLQMYEASHSTLSSAVARPGLNAAGFTVEAMTGDTYLSGTGLGHVDLLKIDVEGHDLEVLQGFQETLSRRDIGVVQFEFTAWAAIAQVWLADFYDALGAHGYSVGKLYPRGVVWRAYRPQDEVFHRCNFVAVQDDSDLIDLLAAR